MILKTDLGDFHEFKLAPPVLLGKRIIRHSIFLLVDSGRPKYGRGVTWDTKHEGEFRTCGKC
jgi:hypothetical protein